MNPEGYYSGEIMTGWLEEGQSGLMMCFDINVELEDSTFVNVKASHFTEGEWGEIGQEVAAYLGLDWPNGLRDIATTAGKRVRVRIKHKTKGVEVYDNAYIVTPRKKANPATPEQIEAGLAKLEAQSGTDDAAPF